MPRKPDERVDQAKEMFLEGMKLVEIASQLNLPEGTIRSWKNRYKWDCNVAKKKKCNVANRKRGGQPGNHNATGPPGNKNAEKHGLFSKYLPEETKDIINQMSLNPLDILWDNIQIAYAAIVRAQQIMYVKDRDDITTTKIMESAGETIMEKWEVQQAWDKQANFLKAQARAQSELRSMIKQYDELLHKNWNLATEEQKARIEALKAKVKGGDQVSTEDKVAMLFEAIGGALDADSE